jgi:hypothetical protein
MRVLMTFKHGGRYGVGFLFVSFVCLGVLVLGSFADYHGVLSNTSFMPLSITCMTTIPQVETRF